MPGYCLWYTTIIEPMSGRLSVDIQSQIKQGISVLKQGGVVAFPTDTVYGLGASVAIPRAVERVYTVKERPRSMALPLLVADEAQIARVAESVSAVARRLIREFMPGALTVVVRRSGSVPDIVTAGGTTVAVRIPAHPVPIALIEGLGVPVVGTSANLSGQPSPLRAEGVSAQFGNKVDFVIDGGRCPGGRESTIVDVSGETPVILREGAISGEELKRVCEDIILEKGD